MSEFKKNDVVKGLIFENDISIEAGKDCDKIIVTMEYGQMAGVPWFEVIRDGRTISKWNGALLHGVLIG